MTLCVGQIGRPDYCLLRPTTLMTLCVDQIGGLDYWKELSSFPQAVCTDLVTKTWLGVCTAFNVFVCGTDR